MPPVAPQLPVASKHQPGVDETYFDSQEFEAFGGSEQRLFETKCELSICLDMFKLV